MKRRAGDLSQSAGCRMRWFSDGAALVLNADCGGCPPRWRCPGWEESVPPSPNGGRWRRKLCAPQARSSWRNTLLPKSITPWCWRARLCEQEPFSPGVVLACRAANRLALLRRCGWMRWGTGPGALRDLPSRIPAAKAWRFRCLRAGVGSLVYEPDRDRTRRGGRWANAWPPAFCRTRRTPSEENLPSRFAA